MCNRGGGAFGGYLRQGGTGCMVFGMRDGGACIGRIRCRGACMGCHITVSLGDGGLGWCAGGLRGHNGLSSKQGAGLGLARGDRGFVGQKSLEVGTGPMDVLVSVAQLICTYSMS